MAQEQSTNSDFETAADAVINGDEARLTGLLRKSPELVKARSIREHRATLLHYVSANGVEDSRQKTPANAVRIAEILLRAGAEVDAIAESYGAGSTTLGLTATSIHPAKAGVLVPLLETLVRAGADVNGSPAGWNPLNGALANGRPEGAATLARLGARLDLTGAAGLGRLDVVRGFFNQDGSPLADATREQMIPGFMWACEYGHTAVVDFLLQRGVDVATQDQHGQTGMHWAAIGGRLEVIRFLLERNAPLEVVNEYGGTVLDQAVWSAIHGEAVWRWPDTSTDFVSIIELILDAGANVHAVKYPTGDQRIDELLRRYGA